MKPYHRSPKIKRTFIIAECAKCEEEQHIEVKEPDTIETAKAKITECKLCGNKELEIYTIER